MAEKDPITCHVLNTLTGRPAEGVKAVLACLSRGGIPVDSNQFAAETNADGRITNWRGATDSQDASLKGISDLLDAAPAAGETTGTTIWRLKFLTGEYYGEGNTFWPEVDLTFYVKAGEHYHVPLLLGPYSYTTYRGS